MKKKVIELTIAQVAEIFQSLPDPNIYVQVHGYQSRYVASLNHPDWINDIFTEKSYPTVACEEMEFRINLNHSPYQWVSSSHHILIKAIG